MYTLQVACAILKVSRTTLNRWIARYNIQTIAVETDRKRRYISHKDLLNLAVKSYRRLGRLNKIAKHRSEHPDQQLYSIAEVAQYVDVSIPTVEKWLAQHNIERKHIPPNKKRVYITLFDFANLVHQHVNETAQYTPLSSQ